jgi:hypothetical protein
MSVTGDQQFDRCLSIDEDTLQLPNCVDWPPPTLEPQLTAPNPT